MRAPRVQIHLLEEPGYEVFLRYEKRLDGGLKTKALILNLSENCLFYGEANLAPKKRSVKRLGREIALGRAFNPRSQIIYGLSLNLNRLEIMDFIQFLLLK